jgi:signal peptidase I
MKPALEIGDKIIVAKYSYWVKKPARGDIIVFKYPKNLKTNLIKRVIGLSGEKVEIKNSNVYIDDMITLEPYIHAETYPDYGPVKVPENQYFVLGDNRDDSEDSRTWGFLDSRYIIGEATYRYWPLQKLTVIR